MTKEQADDLIDMIDNFGHECYFDGPYHGGRLYNSTKKFERIKTFINKLVNEIILTNDKN